MREVELITPYHKRTKRDYLARMLDDKVHCMEKAREYGFDYWDGDRRYGYGGYHYDGRWKPLAEQVIQQYGLTNASKVLDVGCGKAHLLHEIKLLLPGAEVCGFDVSEYGIANAPEAIRPHLYLGAAQDGSSYRHFCRYYDLVWSSLSLHNLEHHDLVQALHYIDCAGRQRYICVESFRNAQEQFNLQCWALTCYAFHSNTAWVELLESDYGCIADYEFIYFE